MELSSPSARVFCPDGRPVLLALGSSRQLGVVAHADDLEITAIKGILDGFAASEPSFCGVVVCDGAGAPKQGDLLNLTELEYRELRQAEQERAATLGRYAAAIGLSHPSSNVRARRGEVGRDLDAILAAISPDVVYTHNPFDAHDTHVAVMLELIAAIQRQPETKRPARVIGCEVWRDLDWLPEAYRVALDVGDHGELQRDLLATFGSQLGGGKRYDLAVLGRRRAHATFHRADLADETSGLVFGVDLTCLIAPDAPELSQFVQEVLSAFQKDVVARLARLGGD
jgi:LmbE family N-acetylglucosaminyl deacetylase